MYNYILGISLISMMLAQFIKLFTNYFVTKEWDFSATFSTGGMPSSHTALVTTLTLTLGMVLGFDAVEFAISSVFSAVIIHDSMGVRYEAGKHATVLNQIGKDIRQIMQREDPEEHFKELLGHKPVEVFFGFLLGIAVALIGFYGFY